MWKPGVISLVVGVGFLGRVALNRHFNMTESWRDGSTALGVGMKAWGSVGPAPQHWQATGNAIPGSFCCRLCPPAERAAGELGSFGKAALSTLLCPQFCAKSPVGASTDSGTAESWH